MAANLGSQEEIRSRQFLRQQSHFGARLKRDRQTVRTPIDEALASPANRYQPRFPGAYASRPRRKQPAIVPVQPKGRVDRLSTPPISTTTGRFTSASSRTTGRTGVASRPTRTERNDTENCLMVGRRPRRRYANPRRTVIRLDMEPQIAPFALMSKYETYYSCVR